MGKTRKTRNLNAKTQPGIHLLAGVSSIALSALVAAIFAAVTVHADARLPAYEPSTPPATAISGAPSFSIAPIAPRLVSIQPPKPVSDPSNPAATFHGVASWYGPRFNGHLTANGEVFDMYALTAATTEFHPRLPLGTKVRVVDHRTGRSVVVRITDRGPLPNGRIIDLSYGAARKLAMVRHGVAYVHLHVLQWGKDRYHDGGK